MGDFFREHKVMLIAGLAGVLLGVALNSWLRDRENKRYLGTLSREFDKLVEKSKTSDLSAEEHKRMDRLDSEIYVMRFKCLA